MIGPPLLFTGLEWISYDMSFRMHAKETVGIVTKYYYSCTEDVGCARWIEVKFMDMTGKNITAEPDVSKQYWVGQSVPILYDPENPINVRVNEGFPFLSLVFIIIGAFGSIMFIIILRPSLLSTFHKHTQ